ncbi:2'-5' RNA ligase family protein [Sphingosinicellaceae bacterium]|nr:2'-5' RNA ligase family protein [Sphingosinicellaceae bacterium]
MIDPHPLILTARPDPDTASRFETLRRAHYPVALNQVPAHISLFHHLPGAEFEAVVDRLKFTARHHPAPEVEVTGYRSLGRGVALALQSPDLAHIRAELADAWAPLLIPQDRQGWRGHVTVQNKVEPAVARTTLALLTASFQPWRSRIVGIDVWRYLGGPWEHLKTVALR